MSTLPKSLQEYLSMQKIESVFTIYLTELLKNCNKYPENIYPKLSRMIARECERFHHKQIDDIAIISRIDKDCVQSESGLMYQSSSTPYIYGPMKLVKTINAAVVVSLQWLIDDVTPHNVPSQCTIIPFVCGPTALTSSLYPDLQEIYLHFDVFIDGLDLTETVSVMVNLIMEDVNKSLRLKYHVFLGVCFESFLYYGKSDNLWAPDKIKQNEVTFKESVNTAIVNNKFISFEYLFHLPNNSPRYKMGRKTFCLNCIRNSRTRNKIRVWTFSDFPSLAAVTGVIIEKHMSEIYASIANYDTRDRDEAIEPFPNQLKPNHFINPYGDDFTNGYGDLLRQMCHSVFADCELFRDLMDNIYFVILIIFINRSTFNCDLSYEVYRLLNTSLGSLQSLYRQCCSVYCLLTKTMKASNLRIINECMKNLSCKISSLLNNDLCSISSGEEALMSCLSNKLKEVILNLSATNVSTDTICAQVSSSLAIFKVLTMDKMEAALHCCPEIKGLLSTLSTNETLSRQNLTVKGVRKLLGVKVLHNPPVKSRDIAESAKTDEIAKKSDALSNGKMHIKYLVNCHVDEVWQMYLVDLLTATCLPANPFTHLVTALRLAAFRLELQMKKSLPPAAQQSDSVQLLPVAGSSLFSLSVNYIDVYGHKCFLKTVNHRKLQSLINMCRVFFSSSTHSNIKVCTCFSNFIGCDGYVINDTPEISILSHVYVMTKMAYKEILNLLTGLVNNEIVGLMKSHDVIVHSLCIGQDKFSIDEVLKNHVKLLEEYGEIIDKKNILLKTFVRNKDDKCLVPVTKSYVIHLDDSTSKSFAEKCFIQSAAYQTIFLDVNEALHHNSMIFSPLNNPNDENHMKLVSEHIKDRLKTPESVLDCHTFFMLYLQYSLICQDERIVGYRQKAFASSLWWLHCCAIKLDKTRDAVQYFMSENLSLRSFEGKTNVNNQKKKAPKKKGTNVGTTSDTDDDGLYIDVLGYLLDTWESISELTSTHSCLELYADMRDFINRQFSTIFQFSKNSKSPRVIFTNETVAILNSLYSYFTAVRDGIFYEMWATFKIPVYA